jgi:hypothetical protein
MDSDLHTHPKDRIGNQFGAEPEKQRLDLRGKSVAEIASILTSPPIGGEDGSELAAGKITLRDLETIQ